MSFDWGTWKQMQEIDNEDEFIDDSERRVFLEYLNDPSMVLMEMANFLGNNVKVYNRLPFSFYVSSKTAVHNQHGIRAKIIWNPSRAPASADGNLELHGDYRYTVNSHKYKPTRKELEIAREFFKRYKILFTAIWEEKVDPSYVQDYLAGRIPLRELLTKFYDISEKQYYHLNHAKDLQELEEIVRKYKIFNMND